MSKETQHYSAPQCHPPNSPPCIGGSASGIRDPPRHSVEGGNGWRPIFVGGHWTPEIIELAGGRHSLNAPGKNSIEVRWEGG